MTHSFDTEIAKIVGVEAAILFSNIQFWCDKNRANLKHLYHGNYWTYNSKNAFLELFPYMTYNQIKTALKKLKDAELIDVKSGLGYDKWDKSNWYAIINHSIGEKTPMDRLKNANDARVPTNTYNKPDKDASLIYEFSKTYGELNDKALSTIKRFIVYRKTIKRPIKTIKAIKLFLDSLKECIEAKYDLNILLDLMEHKEWQSIKLEWVQKEITKEKEWGER